MINIKEDEKLSVINHSCAHMLAQAIKRLYPNAKFWVGPVIEEGFYYDIDLGDDKITEDDFSKIEKEMKKISKDGKKIIRKELSKSEALELFSGDEYKIDLINSFSDDEIITAYSQGEFTDLCRGPHVQTVKELKYFKLLKCSGAYFKGDKNNKVLQRVYGICFTNEEDLTKHLEYLEDLKERDHRKIGKDLKIFTLVQEAGQGLVFWLPKGVELRKVLEDYAYKIQKEDGYEFVSTPIVGTRWLYETSGHWEHYKEGMFPEMTSDDGEEMVLRPMSCPHHCLIYKSELRSYRDLPLRLSENVIMHRWEASGGLSGLERVRAMNLTDAHLFIRPDQIEDEIEKAFKLVNRAIKDLKIEIDYIELALHDANDLEKYHHDEKLWKKAEDAVRNTLNKMNVEYKEMIGEAAFYGPKIDIQVKTVTGKIITFATIQLDFLLPDKFDLTYVDENNQRVRPVMIHRGLISTYERLISILLEQYRGAFPLWLAPTQVNIIPVNNEYHLSYAKDVYKLLNEEDIRVELDDRNEKLSYKMRESQLSKNPITIILGQKEVDENTISFRLLGNSDTTSMSQEDFVKYLKETIKLKK